MQEKEIIVSAENIKKSFINGNQITEVLKGVSFNIYSGEFLCVLGESGSGKSTLLNIIGGIDNFDEGKLYFFDKDLSKATEKELTEYRRYNVGYIFQAYNLMPNLTAKQNLNLIADLVDNPMSTDKVLEMVKLADKKDNYPSQLSGGQQQRVSIARALIKNPKIILADEPTASLDYSTSIEVLSVLEQVVLKGTTLVMVTHNEEIAKMADRIIKIRDGKINEIITNREKVKAERLVW